MLEKTIYGIIEFSTPLYCAADVLGQAFDISISKYTGTLIFPSLPDWEDQEKDPLHKPLLAPDSARTWKRSEKLIYWGIPVSYPSGNANVERALLKIDLCQDDLESASQEIYENLGGWLDLFQQYVVLFTTQHTRHTVWNDDESAHIRLLMHEGNELSSIPRKKPLKITIEISGVDEYLHFDQCKKASDLSSQNLSPRLEYQLILQAYSARKNRDYRMAIIEAATALEISLTNRIKSEFEKQNISFGAKLLDKFRMLGGRFELIRILKIPFPEKDYNKLIIKPRNDVIHKADFSEKVIANAVIIEVENLLEIFSPKIYDDS